MEHKARKCGIISPLFIVAMALVFVAIVLFIIVGTISGKEAKKESMRQSIVSTHTFHSGITVNGVNIGGMTYDEALQALEAPQKILAEEIKYVLTYDGKEYVIDSSGFVVSFDTKEILDQALQLARNGGLLKLQTSITDYEHGGIAYQIGYTLDTTPLKDKIQEIADKIYVAPQEAAAHVDPALKSFNYSNVIAGYPFIFTEAKAGLEADVESLSASIMAMVAEKKYGEIAVSTRVIEPKNSLEDLKDNVVLRSYFSTSYSAGNSYNRVFNMRKAADRMCGTVVNPGETFSTEGVIGRRTTEGGWLDAPAVIAGGAATENQPGGGVCQVSTTLYNAVVKAGMEIVYRQNHSKASSYVDPGLDATINTDTIDFLWKNNTDYPVYIFAWLNASKQQLYCAVYGAQFPDSFDRIEFASTFVRKIEPSKTVYTEHSSLKEGQWMLRNKAIAGYLYESYAYYYKDSKLVDTDFIASSNYRMHPLRYYVYPGYVAGEDLDPYKEVIIDAAGKWRLKYSSHPKPTEPIEPSSTPTTEPVTEETQPTSTPDPTQP